MHYEYSALTPIGTAHYRIVSHPRRCAARDTKVSKLHAPVFVREDVRALDVTVDDTLIVEVHEPFEDLRDIYCNECFRELAEFLANVVQGAVLAEPGPCAQTRSTLERRAGMGLGDRFGDTHSRMM